MGISYKILNVVRQLHPKFSRYFFLQADISSICFNVFTHILILSPSLNVVLIHHMEVFFFK